MTERFKHSEFQQDDGQYQYYGIEDTSTNFVYNVSGEGMYDVSEKQIIKLLNELHEENVQLKSALSELKEIGDYQARRIKELDDENQALEMYKDSVSDVLLSWSQKNLTAKQLQVIIAIMEELNISGLNE